MYAAPFGIFHVNLHACGVRRPHCSKFSLGSATFTKQVGFKMSLYLGCAKSQNLARLREIAKINTRKIIGTPKSQNFVLANNSNIKVDNPSQGGGQDRSVHGSSGEAARAVDASGPAPTPRVGLSFPHASC